MRILRVAIRLLLLGILTVVSLAVWLLFRTFTRHSADQRRYWRNRMSKAWARRVARILGLRIVYQGVPPTAPFFLVSNHLSYLDIICYAGLLDCVFIAKSDIARWPLVGMLARSVDTVFVNRGHFQDIPRVIALTEASLAGGLGIILFPEGTSTKGSHVLPFRAGLLEPAARSHLPVSLATISYTVPPHEKPAFLSVCWWGEMTFVPHFLQLLELSSLEAHLNFSATRFLDEDRKVLAQRLWEAASEDFVPMITPEAEEEVASSNPEYYPARN